MRWRGLVRTLMVLAFVVGVVSATNAVDVTLEWEPATAPAAEITDGYVLYYKSSLADSYDTARSQQVDPAVSCVDQDGDGLHDTCTYTWTGLPDTDKVHYFVATATNAVGESGFSNEAKKVHAGPPPPRNLRDVPPGQQ